jgi:HAD superfamily hydrolase (TIGR01549 family)
MFCENVVYFANVSNVSNRVKLSGLRGDEMTQEIEAIFFDTGNTLRVVVKDAAYQNRARQQLVKLVGTQVSPDVFYEQLNERYNVYKKRAKETLLQASETELWTRWMLSDYPANEIAPLAGQLTRLWQECDGRRVPRPDAKKTIIELHRRGYILGIIANAVSETEIPDWLKADSLSQYFKTVILSSKFGRRKPDPYIYFEAASIAGVKPANCAYVGDNPSRDIQGARQAGYSMVFILLEQATLEKEPTKGKYLPDGIIRECGDLLNFFPARINS